MKGFRADNSQGSRSKRASGPQIPSVASLSESQNDFLVAMLGEMPRTEVPPELEKACAWYIGYLEFKIRESWKRLFRDMLKGVNPITDFPCDQDLSAAFEVLKIVVEQIARERIALTDLVDILYNEKLLKDTDDERSNAKQLVFIVFGWISMLIAKFLSLSNLRTDFWVINQALYIQLDSIPKPRH